MTFEKFYESLREGKSLTNNNGLTVWDLFDKGNGKGNGKQ